MSKSRYTTLLGRHGRMGNYPATKPMGVLAECVEVETSGRRGD